MKNILKFVFTFCIIFSVSVDISAQKNSLQKANKLYELKAYAHAIPKYLQVLKKDTSSSEALINLADCYRLTNDVRNSVRYYSKVVRLKEAKPIHLYYYAQALMQTGNYKAAEKYMKEFKADNRGKIFTQAIEKLSTFYKDSALYTVKMAPFNSPQNDFSPVIFNNNVVFVSARVRAQVISYIHPWTDKKYYFIYQAQKETGNKYKQKLFARNIQNKYNDGPLCFSKDNKTIYITRNNVVKNKAITAMNGDVKFNLYEAPYDNYKKKFVNIQSFPFNSNEYNTGHPAISPDGTRLYFTSDMPGGKGAMDLWMVEKANQAWINPVNLGSTINTAGSEVFPYVADDGMLYFASNGLEGIGGLDIFCVKLNNEGLPEGKPKNLGAPLNSTADDFGITFYPEGTKGYFSSNRANLDINDDIYEFTVKKPEKLPYTILVMDTLTRQLLESSIIITDTSTKEKSELNEKEGKFVVDLYPGQTHSIDANSEGYVPKKNIAYTTPADNSKEFEILLKKNPKYNISGTCYEIIDKQNNVKLDSVLIEITDNNETIVYSHLTDATGGYFAADLKPNTKYLVTATRSGFYTQKQSVDNIPPEGAVRDFYFNRIIIGKAIKIENIYFDYDKSYIRPDAAIELDKIVKLLNDNPTIIIELGSHTDCRGSKQYNEALSDRRAKSSAAYIVSQGIDAKRISGKGYGEYVMIMNCPCEGALKSNCSEEDHQLNRRTEFKVTGFVKGIGNVNMQSDKPKNIITDPKPKDK